MGTSHYSDEIKRDAVHQIAARGYPVQGGVPLIGRQHLFDLQAEKLFGHPAPKKPDVDRRAENWRLTRELVRVTEERDISRKVAAYVAQNAN